MSSNLEVEEITFLDLVLDVQRFVVSLLTRSSRFSLSLTCHALFDTVFEASMHGTQPLLEAIQSGEVNLVSWCLSTLRLPPAHPLLELALLESPVSCAEELFTLLFPHYSKPSTPAPKKEFGIEPASNSTMRRWPFSLDPLLYLLGKYMSASKDAFTKLSIDQNRLQESLLVLGESATWSGNESLLSSMWSSFSHWPEIFRKDDVDLVRKVVPMFEIRDDLLLDAIFALQTIPYGTELLKFYIERANVNRTLRTRAFTSYHYSNVLLGLVASGNRAAVRLLIETFGLPADNFDSLFRAAVAVRSADTLRYLLDFASSLAQDGKIPPLEIDPQKAKALITTAISRQRSSSDESGYNSYSRPGRPSTLQNRFELDFEEKTYTTSEVGDKTRVRSDFFATFLLIYHELGGQEYLRVAWSGDEKLIVLDRLIYQRCRLTLSFLRDQGFDLDLSGCGKRFIMDFVSNGSYADKRTSNFLCSLVQFGADLRGPPSSVYVTKFEREFFGKFAAAVVVNSAPDSTKALIHQLGLKQRFERLGQGSASSTLSALIAEVDEECFFHHRVAYTHIEAALGHLFDCGAFSRHSLDPDFLLSVIRSEPSPRTVRFRKEYSSRFRARLKVLALLHQVLSLSQCLAC